MVGYSLSEKLSFAKILLVCATIIQESVRENVRAIVHENVYVPIVVL